MGSPDLGRIFIALAIAAFFAGAIVAAGLPWLWSELLKPALVWLVL